VFRERLLALVRGRVLNDTCVAAGMPCPDCSWCAGRDCQAVTCAGVSDNAVREVLSVLLKLYITNSPVVSYFYSNMPRLKHLREFWVNNTFYKNQQDDSESYITSKHLIERRC